MDGLLDRLKERKLVQWALAYVAAAFALIQVLDIVAQRFGWPESIERFAIIALAIGFCVTLVLAWYHGERGAQRVSGTELLILALLLAVGGGFLWKFAGAVHESAATVVTAVTPPAGAATPATSPAATSAIPQKSIAVLPFENLSEDKSNAYFADGMQDMILTKLAGIGDLKVISRTSTEKYKSHPDDLKIIAQQLGVATILEGSVQKSGNQVLINLQLIDAATDNHLWAEAYPRTLDNIFGVEGEVAQKVADALKAKLTPAETASMASVPTKNAAAYDLFLKAEYQAQQARGSWQLGMFLSADADYRQAIVLDPDFALAYARLAFNQMSRHWFSQPLTNSELAAAKTSIGRALSLAPDLPEAHLAFAFYHYWGFRHYDDAIAEFKRTLQLAPNNADALAGLGYIARRTGHWSQALTYFESAVRISPRDGHLLGEYGTTYLVMRHYPEADRLLKNALAVAPNDANTKDMLLFTRLFGFGDVAGAREAFRQPPDWRISSLQVQIGDVRYLINARVYPDVFDRRFDDALRAWDAAPTGTAQERLIGRVARIAIRIVAGQRQQAQPECAQLEPMVKAELASQPDSLALLQQLSWVDVCLGRNAEAIAAAQRAVTLLPVAKDAYFGPYYVTGLAQIEAQAGETDEALRLIRQLLSIPAGDSISTIRLKLDPVWDPLRKDPRFQKLIADGEAAMKVQATQ